MAKHKIVMDNTNINKWNNVGNSMSTEYMFAGNKVIIDWKGSQKSFECKIGDQFIVNCHGHGFPDVYKFQYPSNPYKLITMIYGRVDRYYKLESKLNWDGTEFNDEYCQHHPWSQGLCKDVDKFSDNIKYYRYYQAEGTITDSMFIAESTNIEEFKAFIESKLGEEAIKRLPKTGTFWDHARKFKK